MSPGFDVVTDPKWPKQKQHHPRSNVRQCALKSESNGEAGCCEHCHKARRLDAELIEDGDSDDSEKRVLDKTREKLSEHGVDATVFPQHSAGQT